MSDLVGTQIVSFLMHRLIDFVIAARLSCCVSTSTYFSNIFSNIKFIGAKHFVYVTHLFLSSVWRHVILYFAHAAGACLVSYKYILWCFSFAPELVGYSAPGDLHRRAAYSICESWFLIHQDVNHDLFVCS